MHRKARRWLKSDVDCGDILHHRLQTFEVWRLLDAPTNDVYAADHRSRTSLHRHCNLHAFHEYSALGELRSVQKACMLALM